MNREDSYRIQVLPQAHRNAYITRRPLPSFHNVRHGERTRLTRHCPREYRWRRVAHECCQECDCSPFQVLIPVRVVVRVWTRFRHFTVCIALSDFHMSGMASSPAGSSHCTCGKVVVVVKEERKNRDGLKGGCQQDLAKLFGTGLHSEICLPFRTNMKDF